MSARNRNPFDTRASWLCAPALAGCALVGACACKSGDVGSKEAAASPTAGKAARIAVSAEIRAEAEKIYADRCVPCHGKSGKGDGEGAISLDPKPRNYTDPAWQKSITDEEIARVIIKGGAESGLSPTMPHNPDLKKKPEHVAGLVEIIRGFARAGE